MTTPVPQGGTQPRYSPAGAGWGQRLLAVLFTVLVIALVAAVLLKTWSSYASRSVNGSVLGFSVTSARTVDVRVEVVKKPGSRAYCIVRSRSADGAEVARDVLAVDDVGTAARTARAQITLRTTDRAVTGEVQGCSADPISKDPEHVQDRFHSQPQDGS